MLASIGVRIAPEICAGAFGEAAFQLSIQHLTRTFCGDLESRMKKRATFYKVGVREILCVCVRAWWCWWVPPRAHHR